ncbi:MAG TPA: GNAT family protein [Solirubrobacteraceae bacterium]|nr:GNAT family protein [Solirubrobacteraceae bacterium]
MKGALPTLYGERVVLRRLAVADADPLADATVHPEIARWWGPPRDREHHRAGLLGDVARNAAFAIEVGGALAGWMGVSEEDEPDYRHASLDIFLVPAKHGAGLGREALRVALRWLFDERGHHRVTVDPAVANERAIRVYEGVGFRPVGVMRRYECAPDGQWRDGLLMDLLADELSF